MLFLGLSVYCICLILTHSFLYFIAQVEVASRVGPKQKTLTFKDGNISIGPSLTVSIIIRQNIHLPTAPAYTVIKHDGHLRTRGKCRKHEPQANVFYISRVFSNVEES